MEQQVVNPVAIVAHTDVILMDNEKFDTFLAKLKAEAAAVPVDLTTDKGRKAIASAAHKIRTEKARIDRDRKRLTQEWRDMTAQVNSAWKTIEARLDGLASEVRKPLDEWETAEKNRVNHCRAMIDAFKSGAVVTLDDTSDTVRARGFDLFNTALDAEMFGDMLAEAEAAKANAVAALKAALDRLIREEAEKAELEKLRAAESERLAKEASEREAREAKERAEAEEKAAEERRIAAERMEQERIERAKAEAAEAERLRVQCEHEQALAAERRRAEEAEAAAQAEIDRIARQEAARRVEAERAAAEQAKREADQQHRTSVKTAAKQAIMSCGADEDTARKIVVAILAGEIPGVRLEF